MERERLAEIRQCFDATREDYCPSDDEMEALLADLERAWAFRDSLDGKRAYGDLCSRQMIVTNLGVALTGPPAAPAGADEAETTRATAKQVADASVALYDEQCDGRDERRDDLFRLTQEWTRLLADYAGWNEPGYVDPHDLEDEPEPCKSCRGAGWYPLQIAEDGTAEQHECEPCGGTGYRRPPEAQQPRRSDDQRDEVVRIVRET